MKISIVVVSTILMAFTVSTLSAAPGKSLNTKIKRLEISYSNNCAFLFTESGHQFGPSGLAAWSGTTGDGQQHPEWGGRWVIRNIDQANGKAMLAIAMMARSNDLSVSVTGKDATFLYSEEIEVVGLAD